VPLGSNAPRLCRLCEIVGVAGHFNPLGNHFYAYTIKDKVVDLLDPKPKTYERRGDGQLDKAYFFDARPRSETA
jgi:hypothetical protein